MSSSRSENKPSAIHPGPGDRVVEVDGQTVYLRKPALAAVLAWLIPGAGHLYQGRTRKGWMFMICILVTYFFGFAIGGGHVVYASWINGDKRWHYLCQLPVGLVAFPALIEGNNMRKHTVRGVTTADWKPYFGELMSPPRRPLQENDADDLASWYAQRGAGYEMGTWYTMIAGLLNVLVIFDAFAGPLAIPISGKSERSPKDEKEGDESEAKSQEGAA
ncbi:hypothetical protein CA51_44170 [Rosistilla oblonga]|uniref:DUF6677 family protein n=1 Tax=Rosistilla oblonga TaxID=2527990 RepID=UPI001188FDB7|nr:DUF6677 family protein [Rosistilla oblonga]QDV14510.1 hypothetical protein CA51_44170 [Rosistilla oblonga]